MITSDEIVFSQPDSTGTSRIINVRTLKEQVLQRVQSMASLARWFDSDNQTCANLEKSLWSSLPRHFPDLDRIAWHVLVWCEEEGPTKFDAILVPTREELNTVIQQRYIELMGNKNAMSAPQRRAWQRAFTQLTRG